MDLLLEALTELLEKEVETSFGGVLPPPAFVLDPKDERLVGFRCPLRQGGEPPTDFPTRQPVVLLHCPAKLLPGVNPLLGNPVPGDITKQVRAQRLELGPAEETPLKPITQPWEGMLRPFPELLKVLAGRSRVPHAEWANHGLDVLRALGCHAAGI